MPQIKDIAITKTTAEDGDLLAMQNPTTGETYNITKANLFAGLSSTPTTATETKLTGAAFGAAPSYTENSGFDKAFDGILTTSYDYYTSSGGYCGLDLGVSNTKKLTKIRVYPRQDSGVQTRSGGAIIQGSNKETSEYTNLFTFPPTPQAGLWYEGLVSIFTTYRYLRYLGVDGSYCSVSEIEFYGS